MTFRPQQTIAILYQAAPPPAIGGLKKEIKPGGYSDSGADIAFTLRNHGWPVVTRVARPSPGAALDWVFPDTAEGIARARSEGATTLWANTVLFEGHPIEAVIGECSIVGQSPRATQAADDKFATNHRLATFGLPVAPSLIVSKDPRPGALSLDKLASGPDWLGGRTVIKPIRGRGSQGVERVMSRDALEHAALKLIDSKRFGDLCMVEPFLPGEEITITVLPDNTLDGVRYCPLPPVRRFNHKGGIAPYNGDVAVTQNSEALIFEDSKFPSFRTILAAAARAAEIVEARAPIRVDCRADSAGQFLIFDLNMKPNMTGAGRPGREDQDSLSLIAARSIGWRYVDLLEWMLNCAWRGDAKLGANPN